jgi:DNA processing protein
MQQESRPAGQAAPACRLRRDGEGWPAGWRHMSDPPESVAVTGGPRALALPCVAIVGTRAATPRGRAVAHRLAADLAAHGWVIASGLARGIDAAAHDGALQARGLTVAALATGPDICYPRAHGPLLERVRESGCSFTEYAPGTPPLKHHFLERNRLLAGLARGVIVVEAPLRSGALNTARYALDYGREVFAVPGPVDLDASRGCHRLLRQGATLVESAADVVAVLGEGGAPPGEMLQAPRPLAGSAAAWIYDRLDLEGISREQLRARWTGTEAAWVEGVLALELARLIRRLPGGRLARRLWLE